MRLLTRPLKAPTLPIEDFASVQNHLPMLASDKEDGIRCLICPVRGPITGQMKSIRNLHIVNMLFDPGAHYLDGEIVAIRHDGSDCDFNDTQSAVMSVQGWPRFEFRVFDWFGNIYAGYSERARYARQRVEVLKERGLEHFKWLPQTRCSTIDDLEQAELRALSRGKEGLMLRSYHGYYKEGRSTLNEGYLLKVKRFTDDECTVIGVEEEMENCNPAKENERGLTQRSKHAANMVGKMRVGKLVCHWWGDKRYTIKIASGMNDLQKQMWWDDESLIVGQRITFKYQLHGMKNLPRCPVFKSIRHADV